MTCNLERPSPDELYTRIRSNFEANVLGGFEVIPETNEHYVVANDYAMAEEFYSICEMQWRARDPRHACCSDLYAMAALDGFFPHSAGFAQGYVLLTGEPGESPPSPLDVLIQGQTYRGTGTIPAVMPSTGEIPVRVKAIVPGIAGNIAVAGSTGTLAISAPGINSEVTVYGNSFCGGSEEEECEAFRARYIERKAYKPKATYAWLIEKIMEWPCVTRVSHRDGNCCTYPEQTGPDCGCNACTNKLEFYPLFDDTFTCGIPPECVIADMNDWLFGSPPGRGLGQVEIGVCGQLYAPVASLTNVRIAGLDCATQAQIAQIKERIASLFRRAAPSQTLTVRSAEILIAQVLGADGAFTVAYETVSGEMSYTACGDLEPPCDVLPCLNEIIIANAAAPQGLC